jgi:hypothetical protein
MNQLVNLFAGVGFERGIFAVGLAVEVVERILDHVQNVEPAVAHFRQRARVSQRVARIFGEIRREEHVFDLHHT